MKKLKLYFTLLEEKTSKSIATIITGIICITLVASVVSFFSMVISVAVEKNNNNLENDENNTIAGNSTGEEMGTFMNIGVYSCMVSICGGIIIIPVVIVFIFMSIRRKTQKRKIEREQRVKEKQLEKELQMQQLIRNQQVEEERKRKQMEQLQKEKMIQELVMAKNFETALRYDDAIQIYERCGRWEDAGRCRRLQKGEPPQSVIEY